MTSVFKKSVAPLAVLAALGATVATTGTAAAADLGGDCCADLEERIAELEATSARKGNRKVSLEISGHVNEAVLWWDDGTESNVGVYTNDASRTRFRFKGKAKISDDLEAGYRIEIGVRSANSNRFNQDDDNSQNNGLDLRYSVWHIKSKTLGSLSVGLDAGAAQEVTESNLAQTGAALKYADPEDHAFGLISSINGVRTGQQWRRVLGGDGRGSTWGEGNRYNMVKYTTPEFAGFSATANWGEDDTWETGLRYEGELGGMFKVEAAIAYGENSDGENSGGEAGVNCLRQDPVAAAGKDADCYYYGGSVSAMHVPSGIYVNFAAGTVKDDLVKFVDPLAKDDGSFYAFEGGIEHGWTSLGKTTLFGQYYKSDGGYLNRSFVTPNGSEILRASELESYGGGIVQGIDAAAMQLYIVYKHTEGDITTATGTFDLDDIDTVVSGARIKF